MLLFKKSDQKFGVISKWGIHHDLFVPLAVIVVLLFLRFNELRVQVNQILWDESIYINSGRALVQGNLPSFSWSPFSAILYGLLSLPFTNVGNWLPIVSTLGRVLVFVLLLLGMYMVSREIKVIKWPIVVLGFVIISPAFVQIFEFSTDALFALMGCFSLLQILRFYYRGELKHLWLASLFCGISALTRNDGLILFVSMLFIVFFIIDSNHIFFLKKVVAVVAPFTFLVVGYLVLYGLTEGNFELGTNRRSYNAFEQGQSLISSSDITDCTKDRMICAVEYSRVLYGTGEDNNYSVIRAILRNPNAYFYRLQQFLLKIPGLVSISYGERTSIILIFIILIGVLNLIKTKNLKLLAIFSIWMFHLLVYLLTFYRQGYFLLPIYIIFILGQIGLLSLIQYCEEKKFRLILSLGLLLLGVLGVFMKIENVYITCFAFFSAIWIGRWIQGELYKFGVTSISQIFFIIIFFVVGITLSGIKPIQLQSPMPSFESEAVLFLYDEFPINTPIVSGGRPAMIISAQMKFVQATTIGFQEQSSDAFYKAIISNGVKAIYVDYGLLNWNTYLWELIQPEIGRLYKRIYWDGNGQVQVLKVLDVSEYELGNKEQSKIKKPNIPLLISPNNKTSVGPNLTFVWKESNNATSYWFRINNSTTQEVIVWFDTAETILCLGKPCTYSCNGGTCIFSFSSGLPPGKYEWVVRGVNSNGVSGIPMPEEFTISIP